MTPERHTLVAAYRHTTYRAFCPAPIDIRIGARTGRLDRLLSQRGVRAWAFITAWNPASVREPRWRNLPRHLRLVDLLRRRGYQSCPGVAFADSGAWPSEEGVLVLGMAHRQALRVARRFKQFAIVAGRRGGAALLLWT